MKRKKVTTTVALALAINTLGFTVAVPQVQAQEKNINTSVEIQNDENVSMDQVKKFDKFVFYNENTRLYEIDNTAKDKLDASEYQELEKAINNANNGLDMIDFNTGDLVEIADANNSYLYKNNEIVKDSNYYNESLAKATKYKEGVNKVVTYWWGVDVYIKKSTIRAAGNGATVAGIWIPHAIISKAVATGGFALSNAPGGIAFRYNYIKGGISGISGGALHGAIQGIEKVWWQ